MLYRIIAVLALAVAYVTAEHHVVYVENRLVIMFMNSPRKPLTPNVVRKVRKRYSHLGIFDE
jgi:hypothetical protein